MKLTERTPKGVRCFVAGCPAIFETDHDTYIVIGKKVTPTELAELKDKVGENEVIVEIPKTLLAEITNKD